MKKIINFHCYLIIIFLITSCGTREFLGFEKKKNKLEGKRVAILKQFSNNETKDEKVLTEIVLEL